jgi:hypothetical protein
MGSGFRSHGAARRVRRAAVAAFLVVAGFAATGASPARADGAPPDAVDDTAAVVTGHTQWLWVLSNDTDPDGDTLTVSGATQPTGGGTIDCTSLYMCNYTAPATAVTETFTYTVSDGHGEIDTATVTITVTANRAPTALDDTFVVAVGHIQTLNVLVNDSDPDGDQLVVSANTPLTDSSAFLTCVSEKYACLYRAPTAVGTDSFTYTVSDGAGGTATATATITIVENHPPVAHDDTYVVATGHTEVLSLTSNDTDPDGDPVGIRETTTPTGGGTLECIVGAYCLYTAPMVAGTDSFTYTAGEAFGGTDTATVTITVVANRQPDAVDDTLVIATGHSDFIPVVSNDSDPDGDGISVSGNTPPTGGGTVDCTYNVYFCWYTAPATAGTDSFTYTVSDGAGGTDTATVTITVVPNQAPDAVDDEVSVRTGHTEWIPVMSNDVDPDDLSLVVTAATPPTGGGTVDCPTYSSACVYTAPATTGTDSFTYTVSDGHGGTDTATVTITILPNTAPIAVDDTATVTAGHTQSLYVTSNDSDPDGDAVGVSSVGSPSHGTVDCTSGYYCSYTAPATGDTDSFTYTASDGAGGTSTATVTVTIIGNRPPDAVDDTVTVRPGETTYVNALFNDADPDGDPVTISAVTQPVGGGTVGCTLPYTCYYTAPTSLGTDSFTYTVSDGYGGTDTATVAVAVVANRAPEAIDDSVTTPEDTPGFISVIWNDTDPEGDVLNARGSGSGDRGLGTFSCVNSYCEYIPTANVSGTDSFTYTVDDGHGGTDTGTATVTITPVNDAPAAVDDALTTDQGVAGTISVLTNDSDADSDGLSVASSTPGAHGTVSCTPTGACTYTPAAGFAGTDGFTYTVSDGHGGTDDGSVTVTVKPVTPPTLTCRGQRATPTTVTTEGGRRVVTGTGGPDVIIGTDAGETIRGLGGNDIICALGGDDVVEAGGGNDVVDAGTGADTVNGGDGNDTILGGEGDDVLLSGGGGNDTIDGGSGDDRILGDGGNDVLNGGPGHDDIRGGDGNDTIDGGPDGDTCSGDTGRNTVTHCEP